MLVMLLYVLVLNIILVLLLFPLILFRLHNFQDVLRIMLIRLYFFSTSLFDVDLVYIYVIWRSSVLLQAGGEHRSVTSNS